ncbi:MAG: hypothetical protein K2N51_18855 [Lachnospiraceae bacterium]|nr:hypothetical protein [Lachnospiraceae bacterium]
MSEEIIKVLDVLAEKFGLAVDWTSENVIPYLEQLCGKYVNYEIATSVVWLLLGIICLFIARQTFKLTKGFIKKYKEDDKSDNNVWAIFSGVFTATLVIVGLAISIEQIFDIVTCLTFPEKIIIEELKSIYTSINS